MIDELIQAIFFLRNKKRSKKRTLIFLDEIQNSPNAVSMLRYFYEFAKEFFVIAAGSLLEPLIDKHISFPVGRVEYLYIKPVTFNEYVLALGDVSSSEVLTHVPCPNFAHEKLLKQFYQYTLIGGMPEVVRIYTETLDFHQLKPVYEGLLRSYLEDVEKYARNKILARVMRHAVESSFYSAVPVFMCHDDICWTSGPVMSPGWYRKAIFPRLKKLLEPLLEAGKKIIFASDGNYTEFFDDIVDCGAHMLVMEPSCDMKLFADKYGKTHGFVGNADTRILLSGTKQDIYNEVKRCMHIGKKYSGFIMAVGNHIPPNTPVENALYYNEAYLELRKR